MQKQEAGISGYLARAELVSQEADWEGFQPDLGGCSLQNLKMSDRSTSLGSHRPPGVGRSCLKAAAAHLGKQKQLGMEPVFKAGDKHFSPFEFTGCMILSQVPFSILGKRLYHLSSAESGWTKYIPAWITTGKSVLTIVRASENILSQLLNNQIIEDLRTSNRTLEKHLRNTCPL